MLRGCLGGGGNGEKFLLTYIHRSDLAHRWTAFGERTRFVEDDLRHRSEALEGLASPHQNAALGSLTSTAYDGERR